MGLIKCTDVSGCARIPVHLQASIGKAFHDMHTLLTTFIRSINIAGTGINNTTHPRLETLPRFIRAMCAYRGNPRGYWLRAARIYVCIDVQSVHFWR